MKKTLLFLFNFLTLALTCNAQDGSLDNTFLGNGADNTVTTIAIHPSTPSINIGGYNYLGEGNIVVTGSFHNYDGVAKNYVVRLKTDGLLDSSFHNDCYDSDGTIFATTIMSNNKMIFSGDFKHFNWTPAYGVIRLNPNGSMDISFNPNLALTYGILTSDRNRIYTNCVQSDGKIIIGGNFKLLNNISVKRYLARLNSDGSLDTTFNYQGPNFKVDVALVQPDGKILIAGDFTTYNGIARNHIARLNSDGSLDTSFDPGAGANASVRSLNLQSDGQIIVAGDFNSFNNASVNRIVRLNTDGSLDNTFQYAIGLNGGVYSSKIQTNGKIVVGGSFNAYNGISRNGLARLNADGTLDTTFDLGTGANGLVNAVCLQSDGKALIGGEFYEYNGVPKNSITRVNASNTLRTNSYLFENGDLIIMNTNSVLQIKSRNRAIKTVAVYDILGKKVHYNSNVNANELNIDSLLSKNQVLIVKVIDVDNNETTAKVLY